MCFYYELTQVSNIVQRHIKFKCFHSAWMIFIQLVPLSLLVLVFVQHVSADVQRRVYINGDSGQSVILTDGETITITPSQTYDIFCSGSQYAKHWYRESDSSKSSITRLSQTTTSPDVYAINTHGYVLTLQFRPFQSTHAGEYECGFTRSGQTLTPLSVFLSK